MLKEVVREMYKPYQEARDRYDKVLKVTNVLTVAGSLTCWFILEMLGYPGEGFTVSVLVFGVSLVTSFWCTHKSEQLSGRIEDIVSVYRETGEGKAEIEEAEALYHRPWVICVRDGEIYYGPEGGEMTKG